MLQMDDALNISFTDEDVTTRSKNGEEDNGVSGGHNTAGNGLDTMVYINCSIVYCNY